MVTLEHGEMNSERAVEGRSVYLRAVAKVTENLPPTSPPTGLG